ncbi:hypothetical protein [Hydrogenophaga sp.]|uniref:hypothetical protein n=1 Tax=Hydrogenophaga sp. TaxID=1904254 RepID=UPI002FC71363
MNPRTPRRGNVLVTVFTAGLVAACFWAAGYFSSRFINDVLFAGLLKYAIGLVSVVWVFSLLVYQKLSDATDIPGIDFRQHRHLEAEIRSRLNWFWVRAMFLALMALVLYLPSILLDAKIVVPAGVFGAACAALSVSLFSLWGLWHELEEIRELKSHIKEIERRETERANQVKSLKEGLKGHWEPDEKLDGFRTGHTPDE